MSNTVPEGWVRKPLRSVVERVRRSVAGEPKHVLTISSTSGWVDQRQKWARNMAGESLQKYTYLKDGEFSYNRGNSKTFPYGCVFKLSGWGEAAVPNVYHSFKVDPDQVDPDFIEHSFHGGRLDSQLRAIITSSARANGLLNITAGDFFEIELEYPPLPEQQKIAAILSSVDDVIEKTRAQIDKLKDLKTGMMQELLTKGIGSGGVPHTEFKDSPVGRVPEDWTVCALDHVVKGIIDCEHKTAPYVESSEYLVVRTTNVRHGQLIYEDMKFTTRSGFSEWTKRAVPSAGDVLFTREAPAGESCMVPGGVKICMGQRMVLLRPDTDKIYPFFFSLFLTSETAKLAIYELSIGTTVTRINIEDIRRIPCVLPPLEEQKAIYSKIQSIQSLITSKQEKLRSQSNVKKALMQDLLTGKVRVNIDQKESAVS